jgi:hypothetical protein
VRVYRRGSQGESVGHGWGRGPTVTMAVLVIVAVFGIAVAGPTLGDPAGATGSDWQLSTGFPANVLPDAISCPTATDCVAVGSNGADGPAVVVTSDGGATWASEPVPAGAGQLNAVDCTSAEDCTAVGGVGLGGSSLVFETDDGGTSWFTFPPPGARGPLNGVSCTTGFNCTAVGGSGAYGTIVDVGDNETPENLPTVGPLSGISCSIAGNCYAVGTDGVLATFNGVDWVAQTVPTWPGGPGARPSISCGSASQCVAVKQNAILTTEDSGAIWTSQTVPADVSDLQGVSCAPSTTDCTAVGSSTSGATSPVIIGSADGGSTWTDETPVGSESYLVGVSCPTTLECTAVGPDQSGVIMATTDGGATWNGDVIPAGVNAAYAIACPATSDCYAVGNADQLDGTILATTDGGATWTSQTAPSGVTELFGVACSSPSDCTAVGSDSHSSSGVLITTTDAGSTWTSEPVPSSVAVLSAVACPTTTGCIAVGSGSGGDNGVILTTEGGVTWISGDSSYAVTPGGIACASALNCQVVVGPDNLVTSDGGGTWMAGGLDGLLANVSGISCPSVEDCYAVGFGNGGGDLAISATTDGGATWTSQSVPAGAQIVPTPAFADAGIDCPTTLLCYAAAGQLISSSPDVPEGALPGDILVTTDGGGTWSSEPLPLSAGGLTGIACPSASACFASGYDGSSPADGASVLRYSGPSISTTSLPSGVVSGSYSQTLTATGGSGPYTWSVASGQLPTGLALDPRSGTISGTPVSAGTQSVTFEATDADGSPATASLSLAIARATTMVSGSADPDHGSFGTNVTLSATVASPGSVPTGPVTFTEGGHQVCTATLSSGTASCQSDALPVGSDTVTVSFPGGPDFLPSSTTTTVVVTRSVPEMNPVPVPQSAYGSTVVYSVEIAGQQPDEPFPTGTVTFETGSVELCPNARLTDYATLDDGENVSRASCPSFRVPVGSPAVLVEYSGDHNYLHDTGQISVDVVKSPTSTKVSIDPTSSTLGQEVTYSATVSGRGSVPTGSVHFDVAAKPLCTATLDALGRGSCRSAAAPVGNDAVRATYSGDADQDGSSGKSTLTVKPQGYILVGADGGIFTFGSAQFFGSTGSLRLQRPVVGISPTTNRGGYWLVASDGGTFAFGDAGFFGSIPDLGMAPAGSSGTGPKLSAPIVGMVPSADGGGYFMVGADGGVFAFGDAQFSGSCPGIGGCRGTAVAVMPDASGRGYWLVTNSGDVYAFGDATDYGSPGALGNVASAVRTPDGKGYWILFSDGTVAPFGDAAHLGSPPLGVVGGLDPATAIATTADGHGYWIADAEGGVYPFGDASHEGDLSGHGLNAPIVAGVGW